MAKTYVAYTELGGIKPGEEVNPAAYDLETWKYMVEHEVVVPKNSANDPNVLAEQAEEKKSATEDITGADGGAVQSAKLSAAEEAHKAAGGDSSTQEDEEPDPDKKTATTVKEPAEPTPDAKPVLTGTPGTASVIAQAIDESTLEEQEGTLAGDNTLLVLFADEARLERWLERFRTLSAPDPSSASSEPTPIRR